MTPMQDIFTRNKFLVKGFKIAFANTFVVKAFGERMYLLPQFHYLRWSGNVSVSFKARHRRREDSLYIEEDLSCLNIYEVFDRSTQEKVGVVRYHFGTWEILDSNDNYFKIEPAEDIISEILLLRRVPQVVTDAAGNVYARIKKISPFFLPLFYKYVIDFTGDHEKRLDRRLAVAALILFIFAHERVASLEKIKYYLAARCGVKPLNKPFVVKKKTVFPVTR